VNATHTPADSRWHFAGVIWPLLFLLVGFAVRLHALDARPLWWDEGLTLTFAYLPPRENAAFAVATADVNPPLYRWSVGALTALGGVSLFTSRLVTVYTSLIVVAAAYALGRRALGHAAAAWALPLLALSPLQIYYAQEAKGYAFAAAAVLLNVIFWWEIQRRSLRLEPVMPAIKNGARASRQPSHPGGRSLLAWVGYALTLLLAMGANYLTLFAVILQNAFTLVLSLQAQRLGVAWRAIAYHWGRWLALQTTALLPLLPYVLATFGGTTTGLSETAATESPLDPAGYTWRFLAAFAGGEEGDTAWRLPLAVALLLLAAAGWLLNSRRPQRGYLAAWLLGPLLMGYFFHLQVPWFYPRFLLFAQPALLLLAGAGLAALCRWHSKLPPLFLMVLLLLHLSLVQHHYRAPARYAEDVAWPELFAAMRPYVREGDGLIARYPWMPGYMAVYLPPAPEPEWVLGFFEAEELDGQLATLLSHYGRIWQIDYQTTPWDPHNDSAQWLRGRAALPYWQAAGPGYASLFVDPERLAGERPSEPTVSGFANGVRVRWSPYQGHAGPGEPAGLQLTWWTERPLDAHLVRFLHLVSGNDLLVAQVDSEPAQGALLSYEWPVGREIFDPVALMLPLDLPPGDYALRLGLYDRDTLIRIPLDKGEDSLVVGYAVIGLWDTTHYQLPITK
jgi:uncharacterized membrane protein